MERIYWVDNIKAIAIFLVVLGHFQSLDSSIKDVVYSFHLPAFLLITGFLLSNAIEAMPLKAFLDKYIAPYVRMYLFFSLIAVVLWYFLEHLGDDIFPVIWQPVLGALYGVHGTDLLLVHNNDPLWYFPFLIVSLISVLILMRLPRCLGLVGAAFYCFVGLYYSGSRLPWCIDIAGVGVFFIIVGFYMRRYDGFMKAMLKSKYSLGLLPIIFLLLVCLSNVNGSTNLNQALFGESAFLYLINALLGGLCLLIISYKLPTTRFVKIISVHTMIIFCCHIYFVKAFKMLPYPVEEPTKLAVTLAYSIVVMVVCLFISIVFHTLLKRYILRN